MLIWAGNRRISSHVHAWDVGICTDSFPKRDLATTGRSGNSLYDGVMWGGGVRGKFRTGKLICEMEIFNLNMLIDDREAWK